MENKNLTGQHSRSSCFLGCSPHRAGWQLPVYFPVSRRELLLEGQTLPLVSPSMLVRVWGHRLSQNFLVGGWLNKYPETLASRSFTAYLEIKPWLLGKSGATYIEGAREIS